jgi:hypothetical protein
MMALLSFFLSPIGRLIAVGVLALGFGFYQGYALKARLDRSATLSAIVDKQRIDIDAAKQKQADDEATISGLAAKDKANQEKIDELSKTPGTCTIDDAAARRLRSLR